MALQPILPMQVHQKLIFLFRNIIMKEKRKFLIVLKGRGEDDALSAAAAFVCASSALSKNLDVTVYLMGPAVRWGTRELFHTEIVGYGKLEELISSFLRKGGHIISCNTCLTSCMIDQGDDSNRLREGVKRGGFISAITLAKENSCISF